MNLTRRLTLALAAAALVPAMACNGDSTGSGGVPTGEVQFVYTGAVAGSFSARGAAELGSTGSYAYATLASTTLQVTGRQALAGDRAARFDLEFSGAGVRSVTCTDGQANCAFRAEFRPGPNGIRFFEATSGTVAITSYTTRRARGTFTLTLRDASDETASLQVASGTFDVPLLDDTNVPASFSPF